MNMLRPSMASIIKPGDNSYSFVVAVAKRARAIADEEEESHEITGEKPVKKAVEEFAAGRFRVGNSGQQEKGA